VADLAGDAPAVRVGTADGATTTLTVTAADLATRARGDAAARDLFQRGRLRVDGDLSVAHRLGFLKGLI
jgi:3-hydroxyacyl-CoA dehydrogenase/3a,7a,12a-trihydroxy-5b-cholest-24-enoyl-CoA hydratase